MQSPESQQQQKASALALRACRKRTRAYAGVGEVGHYSNTPALPTPAPTQLGGAQRVGFLGRPWAYMDAPSGNSAVGVDSKEGWARVTIAVLVRLDREEQYLPDQNVTKSTSAAATLVRKSRVFNDDGSLRVDNKMKIMPYAAARTLYPRWWGPDRCEAVHDLLKCWHAFHRSRVGQRLNPPMPQGDVTPEGCDRTALLQDSDPPAVQRRPRAQRTHLGPAPTFGA